MAENSRMVLLKRMQDRTWQENLHNLWIDTGTNRRTSEWFHEACGYLLDFMQEGELNTHALQMGTRLLVGDAGHVDSFSLHQLVELMTGLLPDSSEDDKNQLRSAVSVLADSVMTQTIQTLTHRMDAQREMARQQSSVLMKVTSDLISTHDPDEFRRQVAQTLRTHFSLPATMLTRISNRQIEYYLPDTRSEEYDHLKLAASQNSWAIQENSQSIRTAHHCGHVKNGEIISVPIRSESGHYGSIHVVVQETMASGEFIALLEMVGLLIGLAEESRAQMHALESFQQQMEHSEKLTVVGKLTAGLAHEVGNPLAAISSLAQRLIQGTEQDDTREKLQLIRDQVNRISRILRNLVDYSRIPSTKRVPINPNQILQEAVKMVRFDQLTQGVEIELQLDPKVKLISAVPDRLMQVFMNILLNAVAAMRHTEGRIHVRTYGERGTVHVEVTDNGPGISLDIQDRIFDPFFTTKPVGEGTGLGLWVTRGIVEEWGGSIRVQSRQGLTTFYLEFLENS